MHGRNVWGKDLALLRVRYARRTGIQWYFMGRKDTIQEKLRRPTNRQEGRVEVERLEREVRLINLYYYWIMYVTRLSLITP